MNKGQKKKSQHICNMYKNLWDMGDPEFLSVYILPPAGLEA